MFNRITRFYEPIYLIRTLHKKSNAKSYLYLNVQLECNKRNFITCLSLNQKSVKPNVKEQCDTRSSDKNDNKKHQLTKANTKQSNEQNSEKIGKEQKNETYDKKKNEKIDGSRVVGNELILHYFEAIDKKEKETYLECLRMYKNRPNKRKDVATFITIALRYMEDFGVHKDLETYKNLLDLFPKGTMLPTNVFQTFFMHYAREQYCAVALLDQMELNSVIPDLETETLLLNTFGKDGLPTAKFWKMMYWMPKFKNLNPWPVPKPIPNDVLELAKLAMIKISSIDVESAITVFDTADVEDSIDKTWIVSAMAPKQSELITEHKKEVPMFVKGPFQIYVAVKSVNYFVLQANPPKDRKYPDYDPDAVDKLRNPYLETNRDIILPPSVHEQPDATIFAICATGTSSQDSLLSWIRCLQIKNPALAEIPIVFTLKTLSQEKFYIEDNTKPNIPSGEHKTNDDNEILQG